MQKELSEDIRLVTVSMNCYENVKKITTLLAALLTSLSVSKQDNIGEVYDTKF